MPGCQKWRLNPVSHRMLYSCTHIATVGVKGLMFPPGPVCFVEILASKQAALVRGYHVACWVLVLLRWHCLRSSASLFTGVDRKTCDWPLRYHHASDSTTNTPSKWPSSTPKLIFWTTFAEDQNGLHSLSHLPTETS